MKVKVKSVPRERFKFPEYVILTDKKEENMEKTSGYNLVFVFGTLRKGYNNHDIIRHCDFLGSYETGPGYTKVIQGLPYLFEDSDGEGCAGELYSVDEAAMKRLDRLEGHPDFYARKEIYVYKEGEDMGVLAWCYLIDREKIGC